MLTNQPRKSRKRTREIREQSRATGTRYTEAMRANDRPRAVGQQLPSRLSPTRTLLLPLPQDALGNRRNALVSAYTKPTKIVSREYVDRFPPPR